MDTNEPNILASELADELRNFHEIATYLKPSSGDVPVVPGIAIAGRSIPLRKLAGGDQQRRNVCVLVDDGQIIVLGGLIRDSLVDTYEYVPGLGRIPILGALFRRKSKTSAKTNLMVFLRPKVIRSQSDMLSLTEGKYQHIQEQEKAGQPDTKGLIRGAKTPVLPEIDWQTGQEIPVSTEPVSQEKPRRQYEPEIHAPRR